MIITLPSRLTVSRIVDTAGVMGDEGEGESEGEGEG